ncbi:MAG TPA: PfkB family carbohydrate kinase [Nakamurella sp.]
MNRPTGLFVGLATVDLIHRVAHPVGVNEKMTALDQEIVAGGPAANAAVTFALLGGEAVLATDLGTQPLARLAHDDLARSGVRVRPARPDSDAVPAVSASRVIDATGERSIVSVNATGPAVRPPSSGWLTGQSLRSQVLLLDGHHPELALDAARTASTAKHKNTIVVDAGSWKPVFGELLPMADVVIGSADFRVPGRPADGVVDALLGLGVPRVAISRGGDTIQWSSTHRSEHGSLERPASGQIQIPATPVVDTHGAGDVLHGAFAWYLAGLPNRPLPELLESASRIATERCTHRGISSWRNHLLRERAD